MNEMFKLTVNKTAYLPHKPKMVDKAKIAKHINGKCCRKHLDVGHKTIHL